MTEIVTEAKLAASRVNPPNLFSPLVVLACEDQNEYDTLYQGFVDEYTPVSPTEEALVKQIADSQWKLRRLEKIEQRVFDKLMEQAAADTSEDPFEAMAKNLLAAGKSNNVLGLLARYQGTLNRQFHQAIKELRKIQNDRVDEYCRNLKREALHLIGGRADHSHEVKLSFHLIAEDPGCIQRYIETETEATAAISKRERPAA